jgi:crossover junction endodeoxyribonuclease RuvC
MNDRVVIGIDPGLATIGYGILRFQNEKAEIIDFGVIETPKGLELAERLLMIQQDLDHLIELHKPSEAYVEEVFFSTNTKTALSVAHARGVIMSSLASGGLRPRSLTPNQVKVGMTGDGAADKKQVQQMLKIHFSLGSVPEPDDAADALAIAFCGGIASRHL